MSTVLLVGTAVAAVTGRVGLLRLIAIAMLVIVLLGMVAPQPASAQGGLFAGLSGILSMVNSAATALQSFISTVMRPILESIRNAATMAQSFLGGLRRLFEEIVWPLGEIGRVRSLVRQLMDLFSGPLHGLYGVNVNSAQLPNARQLEGVMRNRNPGDLATLRTAFVRTYGAVPAVGEAHQQERDLIDVDDAMAVDHLMMLKMADAGADRTVTAAEAIAGHGLIVAPGTAGYSTAAAHIATLQSNAHMQKMIASALRQEAARLGHDTMALKRSAMFTRESRSTATQLAR